jgi:hypothetical protein
MGKSSGWHVVWPRWRDDVHHRANPRPTVLCHEGHQAITVCDDALSLTGKDDGAAGRRRKGEHPNMMLEQHLPLAALRAINHRTRTMISTITAIAMRAADKTPYLPRNISIACRSVSFDHLVCGREQRLRQSGTEHPGGVRVDDQFEFSCSNSLISSHVRFCASIDPGGGVTRRRGLSPSKETPPARPLARGRVP